MHSSVAVNLGVSVAMSL